MAGHEIVQDSITHGVFTLPSEIQIRVTELPEDWLMIVPTIILAVLTYLLFKQAEKSSKDASKSADAAITAALAAKESSEAAKMQTDLMVANEKRKLTVSTRRLRNIIMFFLSLVKNYAITKKEVPLHRCFMLMLQLMETFDRIVECANTEQRIDDWSEKLYVEMQVFLKMTATESSYHDVRRLTDQFKELARQVSEMEKENPISDDWEIRKKLNSFIMDFFPRIAEMARLSNHYYSRVALCFSWSFGITRSY